MAKKSISVVAFSGSARKDGNTAILVRALLSELEKEGIRTELVQLAGKSLHGCRACYACFEKKNGLCAWDDDFVNECIARMSRAVGLSLKGSSKTNSPPARMAWKPKYWSHMWLPKLNSSGGSASRVMKSSRVIGLSSGLAIASDRRRAR